MHQGIRTFFFFSWASFLAAGQTVWVTFRYTPPAGVVRAFVPGTFNQWGPNTSGFIAPEAPSRMDWYPRLGCYVKRIALQVGTPHEYKFHEHRNASGTSYRWITDPLNPRINMADNQNSQLMVESAFFFQIFPRAGGVVGSDASLVFGAFTEEGDTLRTEESTLRIDGEEIPFSACTIDSLALFSYPLAGLRRGDHRVVMTLRTARGRFAVDSTSFTVQGGPVFFLTPSHEDVMASTKTIRFRVAYPIESIARVVLKRVGGEVIGFPIASDGLYVGTLSLVPGPHAFVAAVEDTGGLVFTSDTLRLFYPEPRRPCPEIRFEVFPDHLRIRGIPHAPRGGPVVYRWANQPLNPEPLPGLEAQADSTFDVPLPSTSGDYAVRFEVTDAEGLTGSTVAFFTLGPDGRVRIPGPADVPAWVGEARLYGLFVRSFTPEGTLRAATERLRYIRDLGFSVVWVLPVMDVEGEIDRRWNIGYNIQDFYRVDPVYGTEADFAAFVRQAHALGLRVLLDVTPNHTSRSHPFALDVRTRGLASRYYDFYQHTPIPHNDSGLGQSVSAEGIVYYTAFSDALLNWNWQDAEARRYMLDVYTHWLREYDLDGFRFDVYWGPHRRYGRGAFDIPLREALRRAKSDILLLGETEGTGIGTEFQYADRGGGLDAAYDWQLKNALLSYPSISVLDERLLNGGYRPGPNSFFLRFLENQDEDRVAYRYRGIERTMPVASAVFLAPGLPLVYQGQEVGMGFGMGGDKDDRARAPVQWNAPAGQILMPHYQHLAWIRALFPAFRRQFEDLNGDGRIDGADPPVLMTLETSDPYIYAYGRPWLNQNGLVVMNFSPHPKTAEVRIEPALWCEYDPPFDPSVSYFLNRLDEHTSRFLPGRLLNSLRVDLPPYGTAIYTLSTTEDHLFLPDLPVRVVSFLGGNAFARFVLHPLFPNPFNAQVQIRFVLAQDGPVRMEILNAMGQCIRVLLDGWRDEGVHAVSWDGRDAWDRVVPSGLYFCRVRAHHQIQTRKLVLIR